MNFSPSEAAKQTSGGRIVGSVCIAVDGKPRRRFPMNFSADFIRCRCFQWINAAPNPAAPPQPVGSLIVEFEGKVDIRMPTSQAFAPADIECAR